VQAGGGIYNHIKEVYPFPPVLEFVPATHILFFNVSWKINVFNNPKSTV